MDSAQARSIIEEPQRSAPALLVRAECRPLAGVERPGPHQRYRSPRLSVESRDLGPLRDGYLRVRMLLAGVCGTDLHVVHADPGTGYLRCTAPLQIGPEGRVLGHEGVGRVLEVGAGAQGFSPGDCVTFESIITCHSCAACRRGRFNQCEHAVLLGMEQDGLYGTVVDVPALLAHDVTDLAATEEGLRAAACIEPAACAYVAASLARVAPGDEVLIFGAGPIGLFAAMLCRLVFGAAAVHVVEPFPFRRALAARWADSVWGVEEFVAAPRGASTDALIETSGDLANVERSFGRLGPNSRVALLARSGTPLVLPWVDHLITNSVAIVGSRGHLGGAFSALLRLCRAGRLPLHEAVTEVVDGLDQLRARLEHGAALAATQCKVLARL